MAPRARSGGVGSSAVTIGPPAGRPGGLAPSPPQKDDAAGDELEAEGAQEPSGNTGAGQLPGRLGRSRRCENGYRGFVGGSADVPGRILGGDLLVVGRRLTWRVRLAGSSGNVVRCAAIAAVFP
jgi:hypothetical protein